MNNVHCTKNLLQSAQPDDGHLRAETCSLSIASHIRYLIKRLVVCMTVVHTYFYIVADIQREADSVVQM